MWVTHYITSNVIFKMFSNLISSISGSAGMSPDTTKNLHFASLSLCLNLTVHMPNHSIFDGLYLYNMTELFCVVCKAASVDFGNRILKTLNGIRLLSLPVSILYVIHDIF